MENNIIVHANGIVIFNGGNPLGDCPKDWDQAKVIEEKLNENKSKYEPQWKFDCVFKLDFDGSLIRISSRFYPPKTHYGSTWDGYVTIYLLDKEVEEKKFDCKTLDELKVEVERYVSDYINALKIRLK